VAEFVTLTASDGYALPAYRAEPDGPPRGGVVVIQEIFGVNSQIQRTAERFAREGYLAIAPAIQDRLEKDFWTDDYSPDSFGAMRKMMERLDMAKTLLDVQAAIDAAQEAGKVGITGYCFGGRVTWVAASECTGLSAASGYYGGGVPAYIDLTPKVPTEMHYGEEDVAIPLEQVEALRERHPEVDIYLYPGGHGFFNEDRTPSYHLESAERAFTRTLDFFAKHLA